jgi:hypothetical protein
MKVLSLLVRVRSMSSIPAMGLPERQLKDVWLGLLYTGGRVGCVGRTEKSFAGVREVGWRRDAGWIDVLFS